MKIEGGPFKQDEPEKPTGKLKLSGNMREVPIRQRDEAFVLTDDRRIDCVPALMVDQQVRTRYRLELTEHQLLYLHELVAVDEGQGVERLSSKHFDELVDMLCYHKSGIDGPPSGGV